MMVASAFSFFAIIFNLVLYGLGCIRSYPVYKTCSTWNSRTWYLHEWETRGTLL